jgi:acyl-CoA reductase-like NAD-dependent aldehyde dehydrogenase
VQVTTAAWQGGANNTKEKEYQPVIWKHEFQRLADLVQELRNEDERGLCGYQSMNPFDVETILIDLHDSLTFMFDVCEAPDFIPQRRIKNVTK